jgi:CspA family cold shock protein
MHQGEVVWYNRAKGYGFIKSNNGQDLFVHYSFLKEGVVIKNGDAVNFEICNGEKGLRAMKVSLNK